MRNNFSLLPARKALVHCRRCLPEQFLKMSSSSSTSGIAEAGSSDFLSRVQTFFSENKKAIIIGTAAAAIAIGGAAYYASTTSRPSLDEDSDPEKGEKKTMKKKGKGKKRKSVKDRDGPILEERKPADSQTSSATPSIFF